MNTPNREQIVQGIDSRFIILDLNGQEYDLDQDAMNLKILENQPGQESCCC